MSNSCFVFVKRGVLTIKNADRISFFKRLLAYSAIIFAVVSLAVAALDIASYKSGSITELEGVGDKDGCYVVLFRGSSYCPTCDVMERLTRGLFESDDSVIADDVHRGELFYKMINFEVAGNEHYLTDYDLYTTTIVLIEQRSGRVKRWKNLQDSWKKSENDGEYIKYLTDEIKSFRSGGE